jgi:hypothetical protein
LGSDGDGSSWESSEEDRYSEGDEEGEEGSDLTEGLSSDDRDGDDQCSSDDEEAWDIGDDEDDGGAAEPRQSSFLKKCVF